MKEEITLVIEKVEVYPEWRLSNRKAFDGEFTVSIPGKMYEEYLEMREMYESMQVKLKRFWVNEGGD